MNCASGCVESNHEPYRHKDRGNALGRVWVRYVCRWLRDSCFCTGDAMDRLNNALTLIAMTGGLALLLGAAFQVLTFNTIIGG